MTITPATAVNFVQEVDLLAAHLAEHAPSVALGHLRAWATHAATTTVLMVQRGGR